MRILVLLIPLLLLAGAVVGFGVARVRSQRQLRALHSATHEVTTAARRLAVTDVLTSPAEYRLRLTELQWALDQQDQQKAL